MTIKSLFKFRSFLNRSKKRKESKGMSFNSSKNIGLFIKNNDPGRNPYIQKFVTDLDHLGKKTEVVCFFEKIVNSKYDFSFHSHSRKGTNFWGVPKDPIIREFQEKEFDFLIFFVEDWNFEYVPFLQFSKSKLIIGNPDKIPLEYLDLGIKPPNGDLSLLPELTLESIKKLR
jgi:Family of unknown function (DUF6913)